MIKKYTPAPWVCDEKAVYALMPSRMFCGGKQLLQNRFWLKVQPHKETTKEEAEANARLIAAAPELLEALYSLTKLAYGLIAEYEGKELVDSYPEMLFAREIIKKATGE